MTDVPLEDIAFPALLRAARDTYRDAIKLGLLDEGYDDVPRNGVYVLGAIARTGAPLSAIVSHLGVSKQAAGQLVDTLVTRGYLERETDPDDRRRLTVTLTERGRGAADASRAAVEVIDERVIAVIGREAAMTTRSALAAIAMLREADEDE